MSLSQHVHVARRFQRAVRIDQDLKEPTALDGFVCPRSAADLLESMARQLADTSHSAFTWTGPYGSGKSSLVVALCHLLSGDKDLRSKAARIVGKQTAKNLWKAMPPKSRGWRVVPVVGRRQEPASVIGEAMKKSGIAAATRVRRWTDRRVVAVLEEAASAAHRLEGGVLVVVDEMGKFLEGAVHENADIFLFQELAEAASRSKGRLVLVGVLHQAFDEYAQRLARETRDEWSKIQGRFVDLVVNVGGHEQLELLARAIEVKGDSRPKVTSARTVADSIAANKGRSDGLGELLERCWPLHPIVACLLGPISRRRFGQNQRSLFGFLNSAEPLGFQDFLTAGNDGDLYGPPELFDYLRANLEPTILASPDGHRWSMAVEAVDRSATTDANSSHVSLLKSIALIDLFRERSGLLASQDVLQTAMPSLSKAKFKRLLRDLQAWSLAIFRRHLGAYSVYAGSDFDIEAALEESLQGVRAIDPNQLQELAGLQPIPAKRHYHQTGALRWFDLDIVPIAELEQLASRTMRAHDGPMGRFLLAIPTAGEARKKASAACRKASLQAAPNVIVGLSDGSWQAMLLAAEFAALTQIQDTQPELAGDAVARREVAARLGDLRSQLEVDLQRLLDTARWFHQGSELPIKSSADLNSLASSLADQEYSAAPSIQNELLNRTRPSSNAVAAQRALLKRMATEEGRERLGMDGFPADAGLFDSIVASAGLYRQTEGRWQFVSPDADADPCRVLPAWEAATELLRKSESPLVSVEDLYSLWRAAPFGIREGLLPILAVALILSQKSRLAFYREGVFQSSFSDLDVDYLTSDSTSIQLRWVELDERPRRLLSGLASLLVELDVAERPVQLEPIEIARGLVSVFEGLEPWARRTTRLSKNALEVRRLLKGASDPNRLIFDDIPKRLGLGAQDDLPEAVLALMQEGLEELVSAYERMLARTQELMLRELQVPNASPQALADLRARAKNVRQLSGDFELNAFVTRLGEFEGPLEDIEGICSLAVSKPPRDWVDADLDRANLTVADLCQRFVRSEAFARVKGRTDMRQAMAVVVGIDGRPGPVAGEFDVVEGERMAVRELIGRVEAALASADPVGRNVILAALAEVSAKFLAEQEDSIPRRSEA